MILVRGRTRSTQFGAAVAIGRSMYRQGVDLIVFLKSAREFTILTLFDGSTLEDFFKDGRVIAGNFYAGALGDVGILLHHFEAALPLESGVYLTLNLANDSIGSLFQFCFIGNRCFLGLLGSRSFQELSDRSILLDVGGYIFQRTLAGGGGLDFRYIFYEGHLGLVYGKGLGYSGGRVEL